MVKKEGMGKGLKITLIVIGIVVGLIIIFFIIGNIVWKASINSNNGWMHTYLNGDAYESFFPEKYNLESGNLFIYNQLGYIEKHDSDLINLGSNENPKVITFLESRRTLYMPEGKDPSFKIWVEKYNKENYTAYVNYFPTNLDLMIKEGNIALTKFSYKGNDIFFTLRNNSNIEDYENYSTIGIDTIFFPEKNIVVTIDFFNTLYQHCFPTSGPDCKFNPEEKLLTSDEMNSVVKQLIDSAIS